MIKFNIKYKLNYYRLSGSPMITALNQHYFRR